MGHAGMRPMGHAGMRPMGHAGMRPVGLKCFGTTKLNSGRNKG